MSFEVGDMVEVDSTDPGPAGGAWPATVLSDSGLGLWLRGANGHQFHWVNTSILRLVEAEPLSKALACTCDSRALLSGCRCGGGAAEIAETTGRAKNPITGLWEARLA